MLTALVVIFGLLWAVAGVVAVVQLFRRKWKSLGIWAGVFVVSWFIVAVSSIGASTSSTSGSTTSDTGGKNPKIDRQVDADNAPAPTPRPLSRQEQKQQFRKTVDESISVAMIVGNPYRYVGKHVDLRCTLSQIHDPDWVGCSDDNDNEAILVTSTHDLSPGQSVRVLGIVVQPLDMTNEEGGETNVGAVKADFME